MNAQHKRSLLTNRVGYKPFDYPWCYEIWQKQQNLHWLPEEVPMADDVRDFKSLSKGANGFLTQILRFFTQSDVSVADCYINNYLPRFKCVEVRMMLCSFANMETIHIAAYSTLIDTIGLPEAEYQAFMKYKEMQDKYDYMLQFNSNDNNKLALTMAIFSAFIEGLQLFASFVMLLNFPRHGIMKGMGQIVTWSIRDETLHTESMIRLFKVFVDENDDIDIKELHEKIISGCREIVKQEDAFIDLAFGIYEAPGLTPQDVKDYIRYIADIRLKQLGLQPIYNIKKNPLPWVDVMINAPEHANFFESRVTEYSKASTKGSWDEAFN